MCGCGRWLPYVLRNRSSHTTSQFLHYTLVWPHCYTPALAKKNKKERDVRCSWQAARQAEQQPNPAGPPHIQPLPAAAFLRVTRWAAFISDARRVTPADPGAVTPSSCRIASTLTISLKKKRKSCGLVKAQ